MKSPTNESPKKVVTLDILTTRALRAEGFRKICKGHPTDTSVGANRLSVNLILSVLLGLAIFAVSVLGWSPLQAVITLGGLLVLLAILIGYAKFPTMAAYLLYLITWGVLGLVLLVMGRVETLLATHLLPFAIIVGIRWIGRAVQLAGHVPLFIPLALIIVLLPLLTEDPWRLAVAAGPRIALLAGVSVLPLGVLLARRILRLDIRQTLNKAIEKVQTAPNVIGEGAYQALDRVRDNSREEEVDKTETTSALRTTYTDISDDRVERIVEAAGRALRWRAMRKLAVLVVGISLAVWALLYGLAWAAMPVSLAAEWSKAPVPIQDIDFLGVHLELPLGPYLLVAALLATVASVGFLGFAQTEDQYSDALWDAVVQQTALSYVSLAIPYLSWTADNANHRAEKVPQSRVPGVSNQANAARSNRK